MLQIFSKFGSGSIESPKLTLRNHPPLPNQHYVYQQLLGAEQAETDKKNKRRDLFGENLRIFTEFTKKLTIGEDILKWIGSSEKVSENVKRISEDEGVEVAVEVVAVGVVVFT